MNNNQNIQINTNMNQQPIQQNNIPTPPNNNGKKILIVVIVLGFILLITVGIIVFLLLSNKKKEESTKAAESTTIDTSIITTSNMWDFNLESPAAKIDFSKPDIKPESDDKRTNNLEVLNKFYMERPDQAHNDVVLIMNNNNDEMVDVTAYVNFYKKGVRTGYGIGNSQYVKPHHKFVVDISYSYHTDYDFYTITYIAAKTKSIYTEIPIDETTLTGKIIESYGTKEIEVEYPVEMKENRTLYAYIIYKKDGKEVYAQDSIGDSAFTRFEFYPSNDNIDFDEYEIGISGAVDRSENY
jgi:hypothetical protein